MFQDELQNRVHGGDQAALRELYSRYSREIYAIAHTALGNSDSARAVVKQVFYHIYRELMRSETDLDLAARLSALTNEEIRITRIAAGDLSPDALQAAFFITASAPNAADTLQRIQARMQQQEPAASAASEEPVPPSPAAEPVVFEEPVPPPVAAAEPTAEPAAEPAAEAETAPVEEFCFNPFGETPHDTAAEGKQSSADAASAVPDTGIQEKAEPTDTEASLSLAPAKKKSRRGTAIATTTLIVLLILFLWLLCGILMDLKILPFYDLGYSLFNEYVFDFFRLP